jgi:formylglycine-generating enzyme required for sulfatase activity
MALVKYLISVAALALLAVLPAAGGSGRRDQDDPLVAAMKFVHVPRGTFWIGGGAIDGPPQRQVTIAEDFEIAAYTVTQEQWEALMGNNPSAFSRHGGFKDRVKDVSDEDLKRFPVEMVSWDDAQDFISKLNDRTKGRGWVYRLPTDAEWEYACRGAATSKEECSFDFYMGKPSNDLSWGQANFESDTPGGKGKPGPKLGRTTRVGSYAPNRLGLYDMHGNVYQWCQDWYDPFTAVARVTRGGALSRTGPFCRAGFRAGNEPSFRGWHLGFRLARSPAPNHAP